MSTILRLSFFIAIVALAIPLWRFLHAYPLFCAGLGSGIMLLAIWHRVQYGYWPMDKE